MEQSTSDFVLIFSIATGGMLVLAGSIILFVVFYQKKMIQEQVKRQNLEIIYQHKMMQATLESQESERRRLATDLHDSIGGMLSAIRMGISTMVKTLPNVATIEQTKQMLDDTISSVRQISRDLMPSTLEKFGLAQAMKELCDSIQATSSLPIQFKEVDEILPMERNKELMVYRIAQELLNNALKHSQASHVVITLRGGRELRLQVEDDGIGFNFDSQRNDKRYGKGLGLYSIENRVNLLRGKLEFDYQRIKGTRITLSIPLTDESEI